MYKKPLGQLEMSANVTQGVCPTCSEDSMFVSLSPEIFRCVTCGCDCRQYINGKISYIPITNRNRIDIIVDV
jgi:uncharacterized protein (DUF983 family)